MFENWQDKIFGTVSGAGNTLLGIAGGTVNNVVNPLLGSTKVTTTTAPPPSETSSTTKIMIVVLVSVVVIAVAAFALKSNKNKN